MTGEGPWGTAAQEHCDQGATGKVSGVDLGLGTPRCWWWDISLQWEFPVQLWVLRLTGLSTARRGSVPTRRTRGWVTTAGVRGTGMRRWPCALVPSSLWGHRDRRVGRRGPGTGDTGSAAPAPSCHLRTPCHTRDRGLLARPPLAGACVTCSRAHPRCWRGSWADSDLQVT